ncbi:AAA family ATPase [Paucibacter sp. DJ1R-11]|uniref:ATP-binding protein n=1 Tax=Paucibacter sp. DJ1R-11 TaxID=2893556 RepID=UPI0021E37CAB|nr:adenylate/guanylate cyclase domain-containing protein [Paucibacter sp. DJ1R-11]MCV2362504.1 AAA family ATPase [Paucibacter sp. DJ1R-11]
MTDTLDRAPAPPALGLRRHLTILFSDLSESTRLSDAMEAEHYAAMLAEVRGLYQNLIAKHGGTVVRIQGDGVLAIFGHPQAREDDGRRATEAALELHKAVRLMQPQSAAAAWPGAQSLSLHSGIHAGMVLIEEGDAMRGRFELLGNTPNVAARLADEACADEILVSAETLGPLHPFFQTSERRLVPLKGRATPLAVYSILGQVSIGRRFEASKRRGLAPFVGRAAELALMEQRLDQACAGQPQWLSLRANAGVGKTRLTEEFLRRAADRDCRVLRGYCESYLSAEPLQPYLQMLRTLQSQGSAEADAVLRGPAKDRQEAVLQLLLQLASKGPLLLLIDDLQWADDASLALLHRLRAEAERRSLPLMLLSATRPAVVTETPALLLPIHHGHEAAEALHHHELLPLSEEEAGLAIAQLLPGTDPFISAEVQRHAGGNPLFIEELCHALAHQRGHAGLRAAEEQAPSTLSPASGGHAWLAALIESRVARLPPAQAQLLRVAAVIGSVIPTWLFERISGCCEKDPVVLELAELDFIFPAEQPGLLRFKHGITRDVIYDSTGLHERQALHRHITAELRAQLVLGGQEPAHELLAYHGGAAGQWQEAAHHAEQAGDQALASSALDRAKKQYRAALAALEHLPPSEEVHQRWIAIAQRFGMACVFDASRADLRVLQHATGLAALSGDPAAMARAQYWLGYVRYALGEARAGLQLCIRSVDVALSARDQSLLAQMPGTLGQIRAATAEYGPALQLLDQAIAQLRPRPSGHVSRRPPVGLAYSLACRAYVLGDQGHFRAAEAAFDEALSLMQGSNHAVEASIQGWRAAVLLWQGRWAEAQVCAAETHRIGAQVRSLFTFAMGHAAGAYGAWMGGGCPLARQALEEAVAWLAPRGGGLFSSLNHGWLTEIMVQQGESGLARQHMALALRRGRQSDWIGVAMAYRAAARLAQGHGQPERVTHYLAAAQAVAQRRGSMHERAVTELCAAELAMQRGESGQARGLLDEAEAAFFTMGMDWHLAKARGLRQQL